MVKNLEASVDEAEQYSRKSCLILSGEAVPETKKDETTEETRGVFDVSRTTKILRRPGPKCNSMSRGRRRFYVTSRRIFVGHE